MMRRLCVFLLVISLFTITACEVQAMEGKLKFGVYPLSGGPIYPLYPSDEDLPYSRTYWGKFMVSWRPTTIGWDPIAIGTAIIGENELRIFMEGDFQVDADKYHWSAWREDALSYFPIIIELIPYATRCGSGYISLGWYFRGSLWTKSHYDTLEYIHPYRQIPTYAINTNPSSYLDVGIFLSFDHLKFVVPELRIGMSEMKYPLPTIPEPYSDWIPIEKLRTKTCFYIFLDISFGIRVTYR